MRVFGWFLALLLGALTLAGCSESANDFTWETGEQPVRADLVEYGIGVEASQPSLANVQISMILPDRKEATMEASRMWLILDPDANTGRALLDDPIDWVDFRQLPASEQEVADVVAQVAAQVDAPFDPDDFEDWLTVNGDESRASLVFTAHIDEELRYLIDIAVVKRTDDFSVTLNVDFFDEEQRADPGLTQVIEQSAWREG